MSICAECGEGCRCDEGLLFGKNLPDIIGAIHLTWIPSRAEDRERGSVRTFVFWVERPGGTRTSTSILDVDLPRRFGEVIGFLCEEACDLPKTGVVREDLGPASFNRKVVRAEPGAADDLLRACQLVMQCHGASGNWDGATKLALEAVEVAVAVAQRPPAERTIPWGTDLPKEAN